MVYPASRRAIRFYLPASPPPPSPYYTTSSYERSNTLTDQFGDADGHRSRSGFVDSIRRRRRVTDLTSIEQGLRGTNSHASLVRPMRGT